MILMSKLQKRGGIDSSRSTSSTSSRLGKIVSHSNGEMKSKGKDVFSLFIPQWFL